jgi:hypothetical protein
VHLAARCPSDVLLHLEVSAARSRCPCTSV